MQDNKSTKEYELTFNTSDYFWSVLCRWRVLLAALLICGILLAVYGAFKEYRNYSSETVREERKQAYELALESYEAQKGRLETDLENLKAALDQQKYYADNSVMLMVDQYNVSFISASYFVSTNYEIAPELFFQNPNYTSAVVRSYEAALNKIDLNAVVQTAAEPNLSVQNPVGNAKKMLVTSVDDANGILTITISADKPERAETIYKAVKDTLAAQEEKLDQIVKDHSITQVAEQRYSGVDTDYGKLQTSFKTNMNSISDGITSTSKSLSELKVPSDGTPTVKTIVVKAVKNGIIGAVAGLLVSLIFFMVKIIFEDRIGSVDDSMKRYGIPVLGAMPDKTQKYNRIDVCLASKLGVHADKSAEEAAKYIAANIQIYSKDSKELLLIGNCKEEKLNELKKQLAPLLSGTEVIVGGDVNESSVAVAALQNNAEVVCVEAWQKTPHKLIRRELQTVNDSGNRNLGLVVTL